MYEKHDFFLAAVVLVLQITYTYSACSHDSNGNSRFGSGCEYACHCKTATEQCVDVTGHCASGCANGWMGPGCQYRDLAISGLHTQIDNVSDDYPAFASDGNLTSCSRTAEPGSTAVNARITPPWWMVWLDRNELITGLIIIIEPGKELYFNRFGVYVEEANVSLHGTFPPEYYTYSRRRTCYTHDGVTLLNKTMHVTCDEPLLGNTVRIQLATDQSQLVLCDVRIYGGRNLAFGRQASQSPDDNSFPASRAVNGVVETSVLTCTLTQIGSNPWWSVDLNQTYNVHAVRIFTNDDGIPYYTLETRIEATDDWITVHDGYGQTTLNLNVSARQLRLSSLTYSRLPTTRLQICEFQVFGDCPNHKCGLDCTLVCHCNTFPIYDKVSGVCSTGCEGRWTGSGGKCNLVKDISPTHIPEKATTTADIHVDEGIISGAAVGAIVLIVFIGMLVYFMVYRRRTNDQSSSSTLEMNHLNINKPGPSTNTQTPPAVPLFIDMNTEIRDDTYDVIPDSLLDQPQDHIYEDIPDNEEVHPQQHPENSHDAVKYYVHPLHSTNRRTNAHKHVETSHVVDRYYLHPVQSEDSRTHTLTSPETSHGADRYYLHPVNSEDNNILTPPETSHNADRYYLHPVHLHPLNSDDSRTNILTPPKTSHNADRYYLHPVHSKDSRTNTLKPPNTSQNDDRYYLHPVHSEYTRTNTLTYPETSRDDDSYYQHSIHSKNSRASTLTPPETSHDADRYYLNPVHREDSIKHTLTPSETSHNYDRYYLHPVHSNVSRTITISPQEESHDDDMGYLNPVKRKDNNTYICLDQGPHESLNNEENLDQTQ